MLSPEAKAAIEIFVFLPAMERLKVIQLIMELNEKASKKGPQDVSVKATA
jgi:hypothetical protein